MESYPYPVKEGQRYINLNPGRLFVQQPPKRERDRENRENRENYSNRARSERYIRYTRFTVVVLITLKPLHCVREKVAHVYIFITHVSINVGFLWNYPSTVQDLIANKSPNSVNSVNACISYNGFSEITSKHTVSNIATEQTWRSICTCVQTSNIAKVRVQNVLHVLEYKLEDVDATVWSLHRWTPGGNVPTQARLQLIDVTNPAAIHTLLQLPQIS